LIGSVPSANLDEYLSGCIEQNTHSDLEIRVEKEGALGRWIESPRRGIAVGRNEHFKILQLSKLLTTPSEDGCKSFRLP
jgi:hypothetical protein